ncbi:MAG: LamG domain-containing protein, partial [Anaerolineales bacterium]|nr:LamG domain-containing protein [Anaerolineales bacterium]
WDEGGNDNFKAVWHLDEEVAGTGTVDLYQDSTSNVNHGDDFVSATLQTGQVDGGQEFDGADDYVQAPDSASLDITQKITLSAWVYSTGAQVQYSKAVAKSKGASEYPYQLNFAGAADDMITFSLYDGASIYGLKSTADIPQDAWTYVVATYDGTTMRLYINGTEDNTRTDSFSIAPNDEILSIGGRPSNAQTFIGYIDEARISDLDRTAEWIATEYNNQKTPSSFYSLDTQETPGTTPAGNEMNTTLGSGAATSIFDSTDDEAYWYTDLTYPTGSDDASIAAGNYTQHMYFDQLPSAWWDSDYLYRQQITITTTSAAVDAGYSVSLTFDHDALVPAKS